MKKIECKDFKGLLTCHASTISPSIFLEPASGSFPTVTKSLAQFLLHPKANNQIFLSFFSLIYSTLSKKAFHFFSYLSVDLVQAIIDQLHGISVGEELVVWKRRIKWRIKRRIKRNEVLKWNPFLPEIRHNLRNPGGSGWAYEIQSRFRGFKLDLTGENVLVDLHFGVWRVWQTNQRILGYVFTAEGWDRKRRRGWRNENGNDRPQAANEINKLKQRCYLRPSRKDY